MDLTSDPSPRAARTSRRSSSHEDPHAPHTAQEERKTHTHAPTRKRNKRRARCRPPHTIPPHPHRILACTRSSPRCRPPLSPCQDATVGRRATHQHRVTASQKRMRRQYSWISLCYAMPALHQSLSNHHSVHAEMPQTIPRGRAIAQETRHKKGTGGKVYDTRARRSAVPLSLCLCESSHEALSRM
jgi:hypothetical protein